MKKLLFIISTVLVLSMSGMAGATVYTFAPEPNDLYDLDHYSWYTWGIDQAIPEGENIQSASLSFNDIRNWTYYEPNALWVHLLDSVTAGVIQGTDPVDPHDERIDYFAGQGIELLHWENLPGYAQDLTYTFDPSVLGGGMKRFPDSSQCRSGFFSGDGKDSRQVWHDTARCIDA